MNNTDKRDKALRKALKWVKELAIQDISNPEVAKAFLSLKQYKERCYGPQKD